MNNKLIITGAGSLEEQDILNQLQLLLATKEFSDVHIDLQNIDLDTVLAMRNQGLALNNILDSIIEIANFDSFNFYNFLNLNIPEPFAENLCICNKIFVSQQTAIRVKARQPIIKRRFNRHR